MRNRLFVTALILLGVAWWFSLSSAATTPPDDVRQVLPELAKGHSDKARLSGFAMSILHKLDPAVKDFAFNMGTEQKRLQGRLEAWARNNKVDLKFHFTDDAWGKAREELEKADGRAIEFAGNEDFQRYMLIFMYSDYNWQRNLIGVLLAKTSDPELKAYLQDSLKVHEEQFKVIEGLLKHYKWG